MKEVSNEEDKPRTYILFTSLYFWLGGIKLLYKQAFRPRGVMNE